MPFDPASKPGEARTHDPAGDEMRIAKGRTSRHCGHGTARRAGKHRAGGVLPCGSPNAGHGSTRRVRFLITAPGLPDRSGLTVWGSFVGPLPRRVAALYRRTRMAHRQLLTDEERQAPLGIPLDADSLARCFTLSRADQEPVAERRRAPRTADRDDLGRSQHLVLGPAVLPLRQARRRRRRDQRALRPGSGAGLLNARLRPARPCQALN